MFAAFFVVSKLFANIPALFTVLQGDERFAPKLDGLSKGDKTGFDNEAFDVATAVRKVIVDLEGLVVEPSPLRSAILAEAREVCLKRIDAAIDRARENDEPLLIAKA
jgi:hypothetical protein